MTIAPSEIDELYCPSCGYNLHAIQSDRCPECGELIDLELAAASRVPWEHRKRLGYFRTFFQTVFIAVFQPSRLAREKSRPVRMGDAKLFRRICALIPAITVGLTLALLFAREFFAGQADFKEVPPLAGLIAVMVAAIGFYFFATPRRVIWCFSMFTAADIRYRQRTEALGLYSASATLVFFVLSPLIAWALFEFANRSFLFGFAYSLPLAPIIWNLPAIRLMSVLTACKLKHTILATLAIELICVTYFLCIGAVAVTISLMMA